MKQEFRKTSELKLWEDNPRNIKPKDFERLKKQIQELGQYKPLLITEDGTVIGGNMRLRAYMDLGIEDIWVSVVNPKDDNQMLAYALSDNDRAGYYDDDLLANLSSAYPDFEWGNYAVDLAPPTTLDDLFKTDVVEDEVPELDEGDPVSKLGEIYQLGKHRLMCGDSTKIEDVEKLMNGQKADMVVTSPPYWLGFDYEQEKNYEDIRKHIAAMSTNLALLTDGRIIINTANIAPVTKSQVITGDKEVLLLIDWWKEELKKNGYLMRNLRIWAKDGQVRPSAGGDAVDMHWEYVGEFLDGGFSANFYNEKVLWRGQRKIGKWANKWSMSGIWINIKGNARSNNHVAAFPVEVPWRLIQLYSNGGDSVLEPYGGSGTTLIACEQLDRTCYMMELDPKYCDVIRKRYAKFIGKEETWEEVSPRVMQADQQSTQTS